ncbi:S24 family peptidase [Acidocella aminolytica]|uniref:Transcriptional regulator phage repressor n=1 Tax=Acidocella aminolytica 101 = DSM 11237 TaxID=1120923 RepID=A0A0D6PHK0_9PROT|nr:helix-turn-helix transcriptional regulator [Acidocella aminolytica]GAN80314.1 transcriptional regulator phage repressor [Acidocella aminolytica 101 = DSM 11237]SHF49270.1 Phage repressor protein C, contains Cro/C1-type HTH and peptisase s24 domains [Acidocella aminolytica 101 = DSM 11237]
MRHDDIWRAIDTLAAERGLSPSALARQAGLDPTSFNPSKRRTPDGRLRWPSTESLAKILDSTGARLEEFSALVTGARAMAEVRPKGRTRLPLIGMAQAGGDGYFDDGGYPAGAGWNEIELPSVADANAYALSISGESMLPVYRPGDTVIVSPAAPVRQGDRVVTRTSDGAVMAKLLLQRTANRVELASLNPEFPDLRFQTRDILWLHRIVWASQ